MQRESEERNGHSPSPSTKARLVLEYMPATKSLRQTFEGDVPFPSDELMLEVVRIELDVRDRKTFGSVPVDGPEVVLIELDVRDHPIAKMVIEHDVATGFTTHTFSGAVFPASKLILLLEIIKAQQVSMNLAGQAQQQARHPVLPDGSRLIH